MDVFTSNIQHLISTHIKGIRLSHERLKDRTFSVTQHSVLGEATERDLLREPPFRERSVA